MIRKFVLIYLITIFSFAWGYSAFKYQVFPGKYLLSMEKSVRTVFIDSPDKKSTDDGIENSSIVMLETQLENYMPSTDREYHEILIDSLKDRVSGPLIYSDGKIHNPEYRFLYGTFNFISGLTGAILLDDNHQVIHYWTFSESSLRSVTDIGRDGEGVSKSVKNPALRWPHGVEVFDDGSIIVSDDNRGGRHI